MAFISYAQNYEDVMLWRALKHIPNGFYIDVGAFDPEQDSVTKAFYERGWSGINVEPVQKYFDKFKLQRPRDINLQVLAMAEEGEKYFYEIEETGLSTLNKEHAAQHRDKSGFSYTIKEVRCDSLTNICSKYNVDQIHFLKIDVEGAEEDVLKGIDLNTIRPWIILVEATLPLTQTLSFKSWDPILTKNNYEFCYFDGLNRFYIAAEHQELKLQFASSPNVFDGFIKSSELKLQEENTKINQEITKLNRIGIQAKQMLAKANVDNLNSKQQLETLSRELAVSVHQINSLKQEIQSIYHSKSWKVTTPLRFIFKILRRAKSIFGRVLRAIKRRIAKPFIILNIRLVTKIKPLKIVALQILNYMPALKARLVVLLPAKAESECPVIIETKPKAFLSPEGRNIYRELIAKIEQRT